MEYEKPFLFIDTNFAPDEALLTYMAFKSFDFELLGMATTDGFMDVDFAAENIVGLSASEELYISVAAGEILSDKQKANKKLFTTSKDYVEEFPAVENIIDKASDCGKLDIISTAGLSNIAKALDESPEVEDFISHVFILGGDTDNQVSESFLKDPKSADKLLNTGIDLFLLPYHIASEAILSDSMIKILYNKDKNLDIILDEFKKLPEEKRFLRAPLLLYLAMAPEAFIFEHSGFGVVTDDIDEKLASLYRTSSRRKNYMVNQFNLDSFYDFILGSIKWKLKNLV